MLKKVISGGQTGIDKMALEIAKKHGLETGGTAPLRFWTEDGVALSLRDEFGLEEGKVKGYTERTIKNIMNSDATVIFGNIESPGSKQTEEFAKRLEKPYKVNPTESELLRFIYDNNVKTLNVAGNRKSKLSSKDEAMCEKVLNHVFIIVTTSL